MGNIDLHIPVKFISSTANNNINNLPTDNSDLGNIASGASDLVSAATSDNFLFVIVFLLFSALLFAAVVFLKKQRRTNFVKNNQIVAKHSVSNTANSKSINFSYTVISFLAAFLLIFAVMLFPKLNAFAAGSDNSNSETTIIATVDETSGNISYSSVPISNILDEDICFTNASVSLSDLAKDIPGISQLSYSVSLDDASATNFDILMDQQEHKISDELNPIEIKKIYNMSIDIPGLDTKSALQLIGKDAITLNLSLHGVGIDLPQKSSFVYDGQQHTGYADNFLFNVSGENVANNVGTHNVNFSLINRNFYWSNSETSEKDKSDKNYSWNITKRIVEFNNQISDLTYNGLIQDRNNLTSTQITNLVNGEQCSLVLNNVDGCDYKNVGENKEVNISGLSGENADNYQLPATSSSLKFNIIPATISYS